MKDSTLNVTLEAAAGDDVRLEDFVGYLDELRKALAATDRRMTGAQRASTFFTVADLSHSSPATVALEPHVHTGATDIAPAILGTFVGTLADIDADQIPSNVSRELLLDLKKATARVNGRLRAVRLSYGHRHVVVSKDLHDKIEQILGPKYSEYGSVRGLLEVVNVHADVPYFRVYPLIGPRVNCFFTPELLSKVRAGLKRHVEVSGSLKTYAHAVHPHEMDAADVEVLSGEDELPTFKDLRGIEPDAIGDMTPGDFIRRVRDGW